MARSWTPSGRAAFPPDPTWPVAPEASAAAILLAAVERIVPGRMALVVQTGIAPEGASESARRLQSDPLRTLAEAIRNGEADPVASEPVSTGAQMQPAPSWPERAIAVLRPFTYRNLASAPVLVTEGSALVPGPVAERAIAQELALSADTPEGRTALAQHREGRPAGLRPPEAIGVTDLDLDLGAWAEGGQREAA